MFSKRWIRPELLEHAEQTDAQANLSDLVRINTRFGGHSTIRKLMAKAAGPREAFTVLDIGSASGDTAALIARSHPRARVTSLDRSLFNLREAPAPRVIADAFHLPFGENSFDFVISSLFLHHFSDEQVVGLLRDFYRVSRRALLAVDLERNIVPYLFLRSSRSIFRWCDITVEDGLRSVRASFRAGELENLATAAGVRNPVVEAHRPAFRITVLGAK